MVESSRSRESEREHVDGAVEESSGRQFIELLLCWSLIGCRCSSVSQVLPAGSFAARPKPTRRWGRSLASGSSTSRSVCERGAVIGGMEARHHFGSNYRQAELATSLRDPFLGATLTARLHQKAS